jgi:mannosidase alpha-like ER degradation enhancer 1
MLILFSTNIAANDVAGNFSLTLVDVLDTLVVLDDREEFENAVQNVIRWVQFDVNTKPQVFETTIRMLGGLLSGHIFASRQGQPFYLPWYRGELLELARDLGNRLLPAFSTRTGIPYARVLSIVCFGLRISTQNIYKRSIFAKVSFEEKLWKHVSD